MDDTVSVGEPVCESDRVDSVCVVEYFADMVCVGHANVTLPLVILFAVGAGVGAAAIFSVEVVFAGNLVVVGAGALSVCFGAAVLALEGGGAFFAIVGAPIVATGGCGEIGDG